MPLIFPLNPSASQTYQSGSSATYRWNGTYWATDIAPTATVITSTTASFVNTLRQPVVISGSVNISGSLLVNGVAPGAGGGATVTVSGSAPSGSQPTGSLWYNPTNNGLYVQATAPTGSNYTLINQPPVRISDIRPSSSFSGSLWWNEDDGNLYVQVTTPTGSVWVPATNTVAGGEYGATFTSVNTGSTWTINHNLNTTTPIVTVYSGSAVMIPATIVSTTPNQTQITFSGSVAGTAVLSTGVGGPTSSSFALTAVTSTSSSFATTSSFAQPSLPGYTDGGTITIGAVTTAPTKGSIITDRVYYRQLGPKVWDVVYNWYNNSGGTTGTGDYLVTLPAGLQFNSSALGQGFRTDVITGGQLNNSLGFAPAMLGTAFPLITAVPYDATRFRIFIYLASSSIPAFWGPAYGPLNQLSIFKLQFTFTAL